MDFCARRSPSATYVQVRRSESVVSVCLATEHQSRPTLVMAVKENVAESWPSRVVALINHQRRRAQRRIRVVVYLCPNKAKSNVPCSFRFWTKPCCKNARTMSNNFLKNRLLSCKAKTSHRAFSPRLNRVIFADFVFF